MRCKAPHLTGRPHLANRFTCGVKNGLFLSLFPLWPLPAPSPAPHSLDLFSREVQRTRWFHNLMSGSISVEHNMRFGKDEAGSVCARRVVVYGCVLQSRVPKCFSSLLFNSWSRNRKERPYNFFCKCQMWKRFHDDQDVIKNSIFLDYEGKNNVKM